MIVRSAFPVVAASLTVVQGFTLVPPVAWNKVAVRTHGAATLPVREVPSFGNAVTRVCAASSEPVSQSIRLRFLRSHGAKQLRERLAEVSAVQNNAATPLKLLASLLRFTLLSALLFVPIVLYGNLYTLPANALLALQSATANAGQLAATASQAAANAASSIAATPTVAQAIGAAKSASQAAFDTATPLLQGLAHTVSTAPQQALSSISISVDQWLLIEKALLALSVAPIIDALFVRPAEYLLARFKLWRIGMR